MKGLVLLFSLSVLLALGGEEIHRVPRASWGLGFSSSAFFPEYTNADLLRITSNGFNMVELKMEHVGEGQVQSQWARDVRERLARAGVVLWTVHLPFHGAWDISQTNAVARAKALEMNMRELRVAGEWLRPFGVIVHPSAEPIPDGEREARIACSRESLAVLAQESQKWGMRLFVENLPRSCLGRTGEEILRVIEGIPNVQICFDTNHLTLEDQRAFAERTAGKMGTLHLSDYDGRPDRHWLPGRGNIAWKELMQALEKGGYAGPIMLEVGKGKEPDEVTVEDLGREAKKLRTL